LFAGVDDDALPVSNTLLKAVVLQVCLAALHPERLYGVDTKFNGLLQDQVHMVVARYALQHSDIQVLLHLSVDCLVHGQRNIRAIHSRNGCAVFMAPAIENMNSGAGFQAQHLGYVVCRLTGEVESLALS